MAIQRREKMAKSTKNKKSQTTKKITVKKTVNKNNKQAKQTPKKELPLELKPSLKKELPPELKPSLTKELPPNSVKNESPFIEFEVAIDEIKLGEHQPRSREGIEVRGSITQLKNSIRDIGLLQPILVQLQKDGSYLLISGERRYRSCKDLGHKKIRAVLPSNRTIHVLKKEKTTLDELALFENLQRKNLTPVEEGRCFHKLLGLLKMTQTELGDRLDLKQAYISERIGFLSLPEQVQYMIEDEKITTGQARELVRLKKLPDDIREEKQLELANQLLVEKLTLRKAKSLVDNLLGDKKKRDSSHLTKMGAKKAAYFISTLNDKFNDIDLVELTGEDDEEKLQKLASDLPALIKKLQELKKEVSELVKKPS
jgi:ParB family chromosome partitioning protein